MIDSLLFALPWTRMCGLGEQGRFPFICIIFYLIQQTDNINPITDTE